jgi:DNA repair photolyase
MHFKEYKGILSSSNGMNISRGCIHGCIYCDARSTCYNMPHAFEDVEIKENAPELLEQALKKKRKKCMIVTGAMSDPYIPIPENLANMQSCLEIIEKYGFGVAIQTKSHLILRDLALLKRINNKAKCIVETTFTTFDETLCKILEPRVATTKERFDVLKTMQKNGIETIVWLSPILPFINDTEENLRGLLDYCIQSGVYGIICFGMGMTLREGDREYFYQNLDKHFPGLKQKYRDTYGDSYEITSEKNAALMQIFMDTCKKHHIIYDRDALFNRLHQYEAKTGQFDLFA